MNDGFKSPSHHKGDLGAHLCTSSGGLIEIHQSPGIHDRDIKWTKVSTTGTTSYSPVGIPEHGTRNITSGLHVLLHDPTVGSNYTGVPNYNTTNMDIEVGSIQDKVQIKFIGPNNMTDMTKLLSKFPCT